MTPNMLGVKDALSIEYDGQLMHFTCDGWVNGTQVAQRFGKPLDNWLRLSETKAYMTALAEALNTSDVREFMRTRRGRTGYTLLHPKLAVAFARWISPKFAVWCDIQIDHILRGGLSRWSKESTQHSKTPDRERLLTTVAAIVARHRLPFGPVYEALNLFAGVACARDMNCAQVADTAAFGERLLSGTATSADFARIDQHRAALHGQASQIALPDGETI